jgi:transposase
MARSRTGEAIRPSRRSAPEMRRLRSLLEESQRNGDLEQWRRAKAVLGYLDGRRVVALSDDLGVTRGSINRWLQWYDRLGAAGLRTRVPPGPAPRLTAVQRRELVAVIEAGSQSAGFTSGVWTGPMIGDWIRRRFGVRYHHQYIPELLHKLGFSVQRPRRRLARADKARQAIWLKKIFPSIKKKPSPAEASSSSATKSAFGSTERYIARGRALANSLASIPSVARGRPRTSSGR